MSLADSSGKNEISTTEDTKEFRWVFFGNFVALVVTTVRRAFLNGFPIKY